MSNSNADLIEQGLSIVSVAAMCEAPPWGGTGVVLGAMTLDALLREFFPDNSPSAPSLQEITNAVSNAMSELLTQDDVRKAITTIAGVQDKFNALTSGAGAHVPLPTSINQALCYDPDGAFANLYNFLNTEVGGGNGGQLVPAIESMATMQQGDISRTDANLQAAYLPAFAFGISSYFFLALYWARLVWAVEPGALKDTSLYIAVNYLTSTPAGNTSQPGWIAYFNTALQAYEQAVSLRLAQVNNAPAPGALYYTVPCGLFDLKEEQGVYFSDHGNAVDNFDPTGIHFVRSYPNVHPSIGTRSIYFPADLGSISQASGATNVVFAIDIGGPDSGTPVQPLVDAANSVRNQYIELMQQTIYGNYFEPSAQQTVVPLWEKNLKKLQIALATAPTVT